MIKMNSNRRQAVWDKTAGLCFYCLCRLKDDTASPICINGKRDGGMIVEHAIPRTRGGPDHIDNLVPSCARCNSRKSTKDQGEFKVWLQGRGEAGIFWVDLPQCGKRDWLFVGPVDLRDFKQEAA